MSEPLDLAALGNLARAIKDPAKYWEERCAKAETASRDVWRWWQKASGATATAWDAGFQAGRNYQIELTNWLGDYEIDEAAGYNGPAPKVPVNPHGGAP